MGERGWTTTPSDDFCPPDEKSQTSDTFFNCLDGNPVTKRTELREWLANPDKGVKYTNNTTGCKIDFRFVRDNYKYWGGVASQGKPFWFKIHDPTEHAIFFDDNIEMHDPYIVSANVLDLKESDLKYDQYKNIHTYRAEPIPAI